jgi:hypothetical protein
MILALALGAVVGLGSIVAAITAHVVASVGL